MVSIGVTLLSGGLDSTTVSAYARGRTDRLTALTFYYGQTHSTELDSARQVSASLSIRHELVDVSSFGKVAWYSALTSPDVISLPEERDASRMGQSIPSSYVPLRNTFFITIGAAYLESQALWAIEQENVRADELQATLYMAPNAIDYSGYPDCRPEFYEKMKEVLKYGSKLWSEYNVPMDIETPIIHMSKAEIVQWAKELEAPIANTWSCYQGGPEPCGTCDSCILRAKGFEEAGYPDPLLARLKGGSA